MIHVPWFSMIQCSDAIWRHGIRVIIVQVMACDLPVPGHYLMNQCWQRNKLTFITCFAVHYFSSVHCTQCITQYKARWKAPPPPYPIEISSSADPYTFKMISVPFTCARSTFFALLLWRHGVEWDCDVIADVDNGWGECIVPIGSEIDA